jgi:hypothetical protein
MQLRRVQLDEKYLPRTIDDLNRNLDYVVSEINRMLAKEDGVVNSTSSIAVSGDDDIDSVIENSDTDVTVDEFEYLSGLTDNIQDQLDSKIDIDGELTALASVISVEDTVPYFTGSETAAVTALTPFARTIIDDEDGDAVCTTIGAVTLDEFNSRKLYFSGWDDIQSDNSYKFSLVFAFNNSTRAFSVSHPTGYVKFYSYNEYFSIANGDARLSATLPDVNGMYTFYLDDNGTMQYGIDHEDPDIFYDACIAGRVCYDADSGYEILGLKEVHSASFPNEVHSYLHNTVGTSFSSGSTLIGIALNDTYFGINNGVYYDEDNKFTAAAQPDSTSAVFPKYGFSGEMILCKLGPSDYHLVISVQCLTSR